MVSTRRTIRDLRVLRNELLGVEGLTVDPSKLKTGDSFLVIEFAEASIHVVRSGIYYRPASDRRMSYLIVQLDGEPERRHYTHAQLGFYPKGSSMFVIVRKLHGVMYDHDNRPPAMKQAWLARQPCPCGTVHGDGSRCREWPECVIP